MSERPVKTEPGLPAPNALKLPAVQNIQGRYYLQPAVTRIIPNINKNATFKALFAKGKKRQSGINLHRARTPQDRVKTLFVERLGDTDTVWALVKELERGEKGGCGGCRSRGESCIVSLEAVEGAPSVVVQHCDWHAGKPWTCDIILGRDLDSSKYTATPYTSPVQRPAAAEAVLVTPSRTTRSKRAAADSASVRNHERVGPRRGGLSAPGATTADACIRWSAHRLSTLTPPPSSLSGQPAIPETHSRLALNSARQLRAARRALDTPTVDQLEDTPSDMERPSGRAIRSKRKISETSVSPEAPARPQKKRAAQPITAPAQAASASGANRIVAAPANAASSRSKPEAEQESRVRAMEEMRGLVDSVKVEMAKTMPNGLDGKTKSLFTMMDSQLATLDKVARATDRSTVSKAEAVRATTFLANFSNSARSIVLAVTGGKMGFLVENMFDVLELHAKALKRGAEAL